LLASQVNQVIKSIDQIEVNEQTKKKVSVQKDKSKWIGYFLTNPKTTSTI